MNLIYESNADESIFIKVYFSNGHPISIACDGAVHFKMIEEIEDFISEALGVNVIVANRLEPFDEYRYRCLNRDSVITAYSEKWSSKELDREKVEVIGLWDGTNIDDYIGLLAESGISIDLLHSNRNNRLDLPYALQSKTVTLKERKQKKLSLEHAHQAKAEYIIDSNDRCLTIYRSYMKAPVIFVSNDRESTLISVLSNTVYGYAKGHCLPDNSDTYYQIDDFDKNPTLDVNYTPTSRKSFENRDVLIRTLLRDSKFTTTGDYYFREPLGLSLSEYHDMVVSGIKDNLFIASEDNDCFPYDLEASVNGNQVGNKSLTKRMTRKKLETLLQTVLDRITRYSAVEAIGLDIDKLYVYGSYLRDEKDYGDLDMTYSKLKTKPSYNFDIDLAFELLNGEYDNGNIDGKPLKPDAYDRQYRNKYWTDHRFLKYLANRNHRVSFLPPEQPFFVDAFEALKVYDSSLGGIIEPVKVDLRVELAESYSTFCKRHENN